MVIYLEWSLVVYKLPKIFKDASIYTARFKRKIHNALFLTNESIVDLLESMDIRLGSVEATKEENKSKIVELKHRIKDYVDKDINKKYLDLT